MLEFIWFACCNMPFEFINQRMASSLKFASWKKMKKNWKWISGEWSQVSQVFKFHTVCFLTSDWISTNWHYFYEFQRLAPTKQDQNKNINYILIFSSFCNAAEETKNPFLLWKSMFGHICHKQSNVWAHCLLCTIAMFSSVIATRKCKIQFLHIHSQL